jgi:bla regulator protein BlaR1
LLIQFVSLYRIYRNSRQSFLHGYKVRLISGDGGPFSFWKNIYVNPDKHEPADLKAILQHEHIHVNEWHTADILLAELSTIFYWFNPGVWLMKKAIRENIEFITDRKILQSGTDSKQYQYSLVNVSFAAAPQGIVNHFNISTIKKRIIMMNAKRSSKFNLTRYAFLVPVVVTLLLVVTVSRAALVKKSSHYINPVTAIKTKMFKAFAKARKSAKLITTSKVQEKSVFPDTSKRTKVSDADTNKKLALKVKNGQLIIEPSMYIVDGVITQDYDISKVDSAEIVSINIGKSGKDGKTVVYVRTKNGLSLAPVNAIRINGYTARNLQGRVIQGNLAYLDTVKVVGRGAELDTIYLKNTGRNAIYSTSMNYKPQTLNIKPAKKLSGTSATNLITYTTASPWNSDVTLTHLSDKLIVINGNIATQSDLKRLSAFDIDRMVLKTDDETKELYGDKAKNGVVFIVTKKK